MQQYNYIIIDDEPLAREIVRTFAGNIEWMKLLAEFGSAGQSFELINSEVCDMVFLDINMPKINGLDFVKSLKNPPLFVFMTAYREFAVEAFELNAVDYLVKPFSFDRFLQAATKMQQLLQVNNHKQVKSKNYILVKSDTRFIKVEIESIFYIEAYREYVKIHTTDGVILSLTSMKTILDDLPKETFFRIHRSFIISIKYLEVIQGFEVVVHGTTLPVSREVRDELILFLQNR